MGIFWVFSNIPDTLFSSYVFIPILPASLLDFLLAPTPFLMGVHTEYQDKMPDLFDVVVVNIDEGCVQVGK